MNPVMNRVAIFILVRVFSTVLGQICSNSKNCETCGVCIDKTPSGTECFYPYPKVEVVGNTCHFKHNLCEGYSCDHGGKCQIEFGFSGPACKCDYNNYFMGRHCNMKWDRTNADSWVSGVAVLFDKSTEETGKSLQLYTLHLFAAVYSASKNLQFYLETSQGFVISFNNPKECSSLRDKRLYPYHPSCQECSAVLPECDLVYQAIVQFPYILNSVPGMITRSGHVIGYMANITLTAKTWNMQEYQEVYRNILPVMVNYEDLEPDQREHMPIIELHNCGKTLEERVFYVTRSTISLNAQVKDTPRDEALPIWKMWEVGIPRDNYIIPSKFLINKGYSWTLEPFTLELRMYRVELQVTIIFGLKSVTNFAECYIEVIKAKIAAIISGGTKITVNKKYRVIISGTKSYNPNKVMKNEDLLFSWSCSPKCNNFLKEFAYGQVAITRDLMESGKTYNISLKVSDHGYKDGFAYQEVYVSDEEMSVYCLMNCLETVIPFDPLLLEVRLPHNAQTQREFKWTRTNESGLFDADSVKCKNYSFPSYLLCVEPNSLNHGEIYYFKAEMVNSDAIAGIQVYVGRRPNISCVLSPLTGVRMKTLFSISCTMPTDRHSSWVFEFFDKFDSDLSVELSGRMIGTNNQGVLSDFKLTRGIIVVYLFDVNGLVSQWEQVVELALYNATREDVVDLFVEIESMIKINQMELSLRKASLISELITSVVDKRYIAEKMEHLISQVQYLSQGIMKLGLVTIANFIISLTKEGDYKINPRMVKSLTQAIHKLTSWTDYVMSLSDTAIPSITNRMLEQMAAASVEAIEVVLANRNESFLHTNLEDLKLSEYEDAWETSVHTEAVMGRIGRVLSFRQGTGYTTTSIASTRKQSLITVQSDYLELMANKTNENKEFPLKMSEKLVKALRSVEELTIHLTTLRYNPFSTGRRDISTNLLSLDFYNKNSLDSKITRLAYINKEIDLFLEVLYSKVGSTTVVVTQFDPISNTIDKQPTVLRLDLVGHSKVFLSFLFEGNGDQSIKIYISENMRPDFELVNSSRVILSSTKASYNKSLGIGHSDKFVFVGILPGTNVPVNRSVKVTVHFYYQLCLTWLRHNWVSHYCSVAPSTNSSIIHCSCSHLSFFSAIFAVPPNEIDPFIDIALFLTIKDNWFIVAFMACILLAFLLLGVWAKFKDKKDRVQRKVVILEDNYPGDKNCYLLAVFTGCRVNAGTNANVGVQIDGSESSSRSHILQSSKRKVLKRNSEDWFMIKTRLPLGIVTQIHVWHDNSGVSPDWYCNKMVVYDLQTSTVYTFFVEQWLALNNNEFCEAVLFPATSEDMNDVKRIVLDNVTFGFRDADMSGSILARHPRSRIDRLDRVVILMCFVMLALLVSLAFYKVPYNNEDSEGVDDFSFSFASQDILISFQTFIISSVLLLLISVSFSKAYKPKHKQRDRVSANMAYTRSSEISSTLKTQKTETGPSKISRHVDESSYYYRIIRKIRSAFHPLPLSPVAMSNTSAQVKTNRIFYVVAWSISLLLIICCVFLIILYGLKLGQEESKTWLVSISLVLVQEFLIMSPLKIVIVAILLASTFERFVQISYYSVTFEEVVEDRQDNDASFYTLLLNKRREPMYQPLNETQSLKLREKRKTRTSLKNLLDLVILLTYITIVCLVAYDYSIQEQSHANHHVAQMVLFKHNPKQVNFHDVKNRSLYYEYVDNTIVAALYSSKWYNEVNLYTPEMKEQRRSKWWTMDKITRLVGPPACRQIRVDPRKCSLNQITKNSSMKCIPNWGPDVEDDDDYDFGWKLATSLEAVRKESSAWKYVSPSQSSRNSMQGESWTTYHGGGYMVTLSSDMFETKDMIQILTGSQWINEYTRVVFLDFTLFNANENMFTKVILIAEHFSFGLYVTRAIFNSVQLDMVHSLWKMGFVLFILIIIYHLIIMTRLMNRKGLIEYFSEFPNIYQLFVTVLGVLSVLFFLVHLKTSLDYTEMFQRKGLDVFFEFDKIIHYSIISFNTLTILFCCLSFRLISLWPFGGNFLNIYHTLLVSGKIIIVRFLVLFLLYIFVFCRLLSYLLNCMLSISAFYWQWSKSVHKCCDSSDSMIFLLSILVKLSLVSILLLFCYTYKLEKKRKKVNESDFLVVFNWITRQR